MAMKLLGVVYKTLFDKESSETGTMKAEATQIKRKEVKDSVKDAYSADKDFFLSFTNAYIIEAVCQYFGLEDHLSTPKVLAAPTEGREGWSIEHFKNVVRQFTGTFVEGYRIHLLK